MLGSLRRQRRRLDQKFHGRDGVVGGGAQLLPQAGGATNRAGVQDAAAG
jgi:hypothetical protein